MAAATRLQARGAHVAAARRPAPAGAARRPLGSIPRRPEVRRFVSRMCGGYQGSLPRLPELYPTIRCPTLVLWGEGDRHFPPVHAHDLQRAIPGSRVALVPGGEHWMAWHAAAEVASRLLAWG